MGFLILLGLVVLVVFWVMGLYNRMVRLRNNRQNAFADIDVQLKQRHDLVPQLVEVVKGYAKHEMELLTRITEARSAAMGASTIDQKIAAESQLSSALQGLKVQVEAYPDLKANQNFLQLQEELSDIENKLAAARRFFNAATTEYNNAIEVFPANLIAGPFGFRRETLFDLGTERAEAEKPPKIQF
ncbi:MAG TPA: LemA family protein [Prolixibacteraceae bacterium]|jgi:LemA protein|nr:LemA family protein [Bacteroidales bacterium]HNQ36492.1 LemA family protein [Prolixibacteraceae bacterium]HPJ79964.1 LemA family protein [Prolixibacteraceae bacterium]HRV88550.1 LemA family protein [Prolixibacteraceae bacterium]